MIDMSWITDYYFDDFEDRRLINTGWCMVFAWIAYLSYPRARLWHVEGVAGMTLAHACVKIGDLYYDSDHPRGIRHHKRMRCVLEWMRERETRCYEVTERGFRDIWRNMRPGDINQFRQQGLEPWPDVLPFYGPRRSHGRRQRSVLPVVRRSQSKRRSSEAASET